MITAVLGPPGTGKTHFLIKQVQDILANTSIEPEQIGYFSFTKRATEEAKQRTMRAVGLPKARFTYFRTLHSMAFYQLGLHPNLVFGRDKIEAFAKWLGLHLSLGNKKTRTYDNTWPEKTEDDHVLFLMNYARVNLFPEKKAVDEFNWRCHPYWAWKIMMGYRKFKQAKYYYDYTDMLEQLIARDAYPNLDVIVIDEAQDLSPLQWNVVLETIGHNPNAKVYIAGDDDQAIYEWAGASVEIFQTVVKGADETIHLDRSYRVPIAAHRMAQRTIGYCTHRLPKQWQPTSEQGRIVSRWDYADLRWDPTKSWLVLARNNYLLQRAIDYFNDAKKPYAWLNSHDNAPIKISTIHGAKGAQADRVVLDLGMSKAAYNEGWKTDAEARVWYVALTRAKHDIILMGAKNNSRSSLYIQAPLG